MDSLFQKFFNYKFTDVFANVDLFLQEYKSNAIDKSLPDETITRLYYLLYAQYGNSTIANADTNQFKYRLWSIIFEHGLVWAKRVEIQEKLRALSLEDGSEIYQGGKAIYNNALHDSTAPNTGTLEELPYINGQNTANFKKSKLEGLAILNDMLKTNITREFLDKFKPLFIKIIAGDTRYYVTEGEEE